MSLPIVDLAASRGAAVALRRACEDVGFFYLVGHGVDGALLRRLERASRAFFAEDVGTKMRIRMELGGRAWRGYFPVGGELTAGKPDRKEGLYFGAELDPTHPLVRNRTPMHGANLFPAHPAALRGAVLDYMAAMTSLGHRLAAVVAVSLGLPHSYFAERYTAEPLILFRIFHYPSAPAPTPGEWGVAEHTDYGLLTILAQDDSGGLEVHTPHGWIDAPPLDGAFVCNLGDMLDRMTAGLYRSTPHRVRAATAKSRLSFPFFFDPGFRTEVKPIDLGRRPRDDRHERWDGASVHEFRGTYGDYLLAKVAKVFPQLLDQT